jgi:LysR family nitrogen assimilation transcriptional regulator
MAAKGLRMDIPQLRYFVTVAEEGHFGRASKKLNVAQSALSRQVHALELEQGATLLDRSVRGATLTPQGQLVLERARVILDACGAIKRDVRAIQNTVAGEVRFGTTPVMSRVFFPRVSERLRELYPAVHLQLFEASQELIIDSLQSGRLDLAVLINPGPNRHFISEDLWVEALNLVGRPAEMSKLPAIMRIEDLGNSPLIMFPPPSGTRDYIETCARTAGIALNVASEVSSIHEHLHGVAAGHGLAILPFSAVHDEVRRGDVMAIPIEPLAITRRLVARADVHQQPAQVAVRAIVRDVVRDICQIDTYRNHLSSAGVAVN